MLFKPYVPPNEGAGLLSVDRDICWRINERGLVTPAVIGAVCWARNSFKMSDAQHTAIMNGLGLEYHRLPAGGTILRPKDAYRLPVQASARESCLQDKPANEVFSITVPFLPLVQYDAIEIYPCVETEHGVERFESNEHPAHTQPDFWSVALHLQSGGIETIADFSLESQACSFGELMRALVFAARRFAGLDTQHLLPGDPNRADGFKQLSSTPLTRPQTSTPPSSRQLNQKESKCSATTHP